jgi:hypothetical protein
MEKSANIDNTQTDTKLLSPNLAGMTTGSRKQADGFADHAWDDEVLERS